VTKPFLGIALGGGGVRGAAHVGVLQELDEAGIAIDMVAGVSAGAVVGAMYAHSLDGKWVEDQFRKVWASTKFQDVAAKRFIQSGPSDPWIHKIRKNITEHALAIMSLHRNSIMTNESLREILRMLIPARTFDQMKIPLKIVSTDIETGDDIISDKGDLMDALVKSCAIPGIMEPVEDEGRLMVDGGVGMPIPVPALKEDCQMTLAVDIGLYEFERLNRPNARTIKIRSDIITSNRLKTRLASEADLVIKPDTLGFHWSRFDSGEILFQNGRKAAKERLSRLMKMIEKNKKNKK
jgi:NTE family protein|tara:strand:- start:4452 stop:5333 length:882 start_codon:yes stop_codon:yes gene_type:complete